MEDIHLTENKNSEPKQVVGNFLGMQLGERPTKVLIFLNNDILAIYAHGIISPAEKQMLQSESDFKMLAEYKTQEFDSVKNELTKQVQKIIGVPIKNVQTLITKDGIRIINIGINVGQASK